MRVSFSSGNDIIIFALVASPTTSFPAQNTVSSPSYTSPLTAPSPIHDEVLERISRLELELQHINLIDKSTLKVDKYFVQLAEDVIRDRKPSFADRLQEKVKWMSGHNAVCSLAYSAKFRADVTSLLQDIGYNDTIKIQNASLQDDRVIGHLFRTRCTSLFSRVTTPTSSFKPAGYSKSCVT
ncbi:hypothetical protein DFH06DRAFT_577322 [Mycena polygramma]|nr:hypothetical protein DFH06DRAFT_577322 [Mycena polygramma]